ncbi:hypothetical protein [Flavobacterium sp.]|jgi:CRISPR/Cas system CSM-associated protein Csm5 (group 7 of RAMP superfamily)|uniref:hypothetical protein n=1 Tax=Flavobacterium sp. TaxID=239 RepID=UPI0037BEEF43
MKNNQEIKLIDGIFSVEDADKVITKLINYKIDYHIREDFSNHIRFNNNIEHSNIRVEELNQTIIAFKRFIKEHSNNSVKFKIKSFISIEQEE